MILKDAERLAAQGVRYTRQLDALEAKLRDRPEDPLRVEWEKQRQSFVVKLDKLAEEVERARVRALEPIVAGLRQLAEPTDYTAWAENIVREDMGRWVMALLASRPLDETTQEAAIDAVS